MGHSEVSEGTVQVLILGAGLGGLGVEVELHHADLLDPLGPRPGQVLRVCGEVR